jgi:hypothetical protein
MDPRFLVHLMACLTKTRQGALGAHLKGTVRRNRLHQTLAAAGVIAIGLFLRSGAFPFPPAIVK